MTVFVFRSSGPYPRLDRLVARVGSRVLERLAAGVARDSTARRNPRSRAYMERLAAEVHPDFDAGRLCVLDDDRQASAIEWSRADEIVLLWPDPIGTGWSEVESAILARKKPAAPVVVLNGRRRRFVLDRVEWRAYRIRRLIGKTLIGEVVFSLVFVAVTPWVWLFDVIGGKGSSRCPTSRPKTLSSSGGPSDP